MYKSLIVVFTIDFCAILEESAYGCFSPKAEFTLDASRCGASRHCASKTHEVCSHIVRHQAFLLKQI